MKKETNNSANTKNEDCRNENQKNPESSKVANVENQCLPIKSWSWEEYWQIIEKLQAYGLKRIKDRDEYTLFKEFVPANFTEDSQSGKTKSPESPQKSRVSGTGVISSFGNAVRPNDATEKVYEKPFLAPLDIQKSKSIADDIDSFREIQSDGMSLNIGFDTEFQTFEDDSATSRKVLSLQMSVAIGEILIRYFFLVDPRYQEVTAQGGMIPLKYCLADILDDLRKNYFPEFPLVLKKDIVYKERKKKGRDPFKVINTKAMKEKIIPVTLICHAGKADISVFRRSKYDLDLLRRLAEIQGGWMTVDKPPVIKAENDEHYNYYWLIELCVRDTLGLTPADGKSLKALGKVINRPKIELPPTAIEHMAAFAVSNPIDYYEYAMNDADIVISFCSELFRCNHSIPITLSSAAASSMYKNIKNCLGAANKAEYDRTYRGLELLDDGLVLTDQMKFLKATRYVPIRDNPDAKLISEYFEEAYTGGFNASFYIGWIRKFTTDFDLQNAYPTAMANIFDIDWSKKVRDLPRGHELTLQDLPDPLIPAAAVGDFDFPDDCYCPNIPVPVKEGMKIYPKHGKNVYMTGPDMFLALKLGAKIRICRGFICSILIRNGKESQCLAYAVTKLVQDRMKAKKLYKDNPLVEKSLKTMVCSCYGKTAQNVDPKNRYDAWLMEHVPSEPSLVTSPYHAAYTTALVRCMLIACINQLQKMGYRVYSVTTDGFITDAPAEVVRGLDAYGFTAIFQNGRYILNQTDAPCEANQVWEPKHYNDIFLNITTRGNVAVNDEGVLAHNSFITGEEKDSRADRDAYIIAVLGREGRLECSTKVWTQFSEIVERKHDFQVSETFRNLSMNFDYKRCPLTETAVDTPVHYDSIDGRYHVDTVIGEFDTRAFTDAEEFLNYRIVMKNEDCVKVTDDLKRVKVKATVDTKGYIGKDLNRAILRSIITGYRAGIYKIPVLDGLRQSNAVAVINSWGISEITINDWKNWSKSKRWHNLLPRETVEETLQKILDVSNDDNNTDSDDTGKA